MSMRTITVTFKTWIIKYFTPDMYLLVIVVNGEPRKAIEIGRRDDREKVILT